MQAVRALLTAAQTNGTSLNESWHLVLITLQHIVWLLNLKPNAAGTLKPSQAAESGAGSNIILTTAVMADIPVLTSMLSRVFEMTRYVNIYSICYLREQLLTVFTTYCYIIVELFLCNTVAIIKYK